MASLGYQCRQWNVSHVLTLRPFLCSIRGGYDQLLCWGVAYSKSRHRLISWWKETAFQIVRTLRLLQRWSQKLLPTLRLHYSDCSHSTNFTVAGPVRERIYRSHQYRRQIVGILNAWHRKRYRFYLRAPCLAAHVSKLVWYHDLMFFRVLLYVGLGCLHLRRWKLAELVL